MFLVRLEGVCKGFTTPGQVAESQESRSEGDHAATVVIDVP